MSNSSYEYPPWSKTLCISSEFLRTGTKIYPPDDSYILKLFCWDNDFYEKDNTQAEDGDDGDDFVSGVFLRADLLTIPTLSSPQQRQMPDQAFTRSAVKLAVFSTTKYFQQDQYYCAVKLSVFSTTKYFQQDQYNSAEKHLNVLSSNAIHTTVSSIKRTL